MCKTCVCSQALLWEEGDISNFFAFCAWKGKTQFSWINPKFFFEQLFAKTFVCEGAILTLFSFFLCLNSQGTIFMNKQNKIVLNNYMHVAFDKTKVVLKGFVFNPEYRHLTSDWERNSLEQVNSVKEKKTKIFFSEIDFQFRCLF